MVVLDSAVTISPPGPLASRPATSLYYGQTYYATDVNGGTWYLYTGSAWVPYAPQLTPVTAASNATAAPFTSVNMSGGVTVTLPAPTVGALIALWGGSTATASTVSSGGAVQIYGLGMASGATAFSLAGGAGAIVLANGTAWYIISGHQDTGWIAFASITAGWQNAGGFGTVACRLIGDVVRMKGTFLNSTAAGTANVTFATLPSSMNPTAQREVAVGIPYDGVSGATANTLSVATSGQLSVGMNIASPAGKIGLDGVSFNIGIG